MLQRAMDWAFCLAADNADQDDVLPARVLEISEETAAIVEDADGPGFNIGD